MTITKQPLQRTVTISVGPDGSVTHAFQVTIFALMEDGVEISRQTSAHENIEPTDVGSAVPQADLLKQLEDLKASTAVDYDALTVKSNKLLDDLRAEAAVDAAVAAKAIAERDAQIAELTAAHADVAARNAAAAAALTPKA